MKKTIATRYYTSDHDKDNMVEKKKSIEEPAETT